MRQVEAKRMEGVGGTFGPAASSPLEPHFLRVKERAKHPPVLTIILAK
jgi:hypothetical protein